MSVSASHHRNIPPKSLLIFLAGVFVIFSTIGFAGDITEMGRSPMYRLVLGVLFSGFFPVCYAYAGFTLRRQSWKAIVPIFVVHFASMNVLANFFQLEPAPTDAASLASLHARLSLDAVAIMISVAVGYTCFLYVSITEFRRYFRVHAEIELATEIHHVLVPAIDTRIGSFEFHGRSSPSGEVGGDLIDLAGTEDHWVAYVADVSGHGVAPGVVMGMVKSAGRMLLTSGEGADHLMPRLNEVLYPLKKPDMFVTFCFLSKNEHGLLVGLAGHPAILHFSAKTKTVRRLESPNLPLGIFPEGDFTSSEVLPEPGDVFALYTDGLLETANAAGEEFGLKRLEAELEKHNQQPLDKICSSIQASVASHGGQADDQSLLLIRCS
jgi:Stage II sporulation protein E (SpoIIE)